MYPHDGRPHRPLPASLLLTLKLIAYTLATPFLLIALLSSAVCVLLDFTCFRLRERLAGNPPPKRLWEF